MKDTLSLFLFVVVIVMATAAGGEAVPSKYYGECVGGKGERDSLAHVVSATFFVFAQRCLTRIIERPFSARPLQA